MTPAPLGADRVGPLADDGIGNRIHTQRHQDREGYQIRPHADDLIVIEQEKRSKRDVFDTVTDRTEAIEQLGHEPDFRG